MPYMINGEMANISPEPQLKDGTLWVPLRAVSQALGANVDWEPNTGVAILYAGDQIVTMQMDQNMVDVNGQKSQLQAAPFVSNGESWVPVRFFESLGHTVNPDWENKIVDITTSAAPAV